MASKFTRILFFLLISFTSIMSYGQQKGIIKTERNAPFGIVSFSADSELTGIGDTKHVDGYVERAGTWQQLFPVGNKGSYRPFASEVGSVVGAYFKENPESATLPSGGPFRISIKETSITKVSDQEFWDINGNSATKLSLTWNAASNISALTGGNLALLTIVGWNSSNARWEKITSAVDEISVLGNSSSLGFGSITTIQQIVPNTYSVFSFASLVGSVTAPSYVGKFEVASCSEIRGWIWDKSYPDRPLTIELMEGNKVIAMVNANIHRKDLLDSGIGTGNYGFSFSSPSYLIDGQSHNLSIRIRNTNYYLEGAPKILNCNFAGDIEKADCNMIKGWAWNKNNPNENLELEFVENDSVFFSLKADQFRSDLKNNGIGTGYYGFSIPLPVKLKDGKVHQFSARIKDVNYILSNSIQTVTCMPSLYSGRLETVGCNTINGWAWDKNYPNSTITIELIEGNSKFATTTASSYRGDLESNGIGTGYYGFSFAFPSGLKDGKSHQLSVRVQGSTVL
ncbi:hypothetical protein ACFP1I_21020, partial [Dyadobacter subterraneus]